LAITRRHLLQSGAFAAIAPSLGSAAGVAAADPASAQSGTGEPVWPARAVAVRRRQISSRFQTLRLRQSGTPPRAASRDRFCSEPSTTSISRLPASKARSLRLSRLIYESLTTPSLDEVSTEYGALAESVSYPGGFFFRYLPPAGAGEWARRQAGDAGGCDLLASGVQEISSAVLRLLPSRGEGRKRPVSAI